MIVLAATAQRSFADDFLHGLVAEVRAKLDDIAAARTPKLVPPVPVAVTWKPQRIASLDLGAPLLAMVGDERDVLWAVTTKDVIAFGIAPHVKELARTPFTGDRAVPMPRDPVGAAVVDGHGRAVVASASPWMLGMRVALDDGHIVTSPAASQFTLCTGTVATQLARGLNVFESRDGEFVTLTCADGVDPSGVPLRTSARVEAEPFGRLTTSVAHCPTGDACSPATSANYTDAGTAVAVADLDRDGVPEVLFASAAAPGDPDTITVVSIGDDQKHPKFRKEFTAGGVVAIAVLDTSATVAPAVIVAVRLVGSTRVDLWRLD